MLSKKTIPDSTDLEGMSVYAHQEGMEKIHF